MIPKSQYTISFGNKISATLSIILCLVKVLSTIQFNDQFPARGAEIDHIIPDGMLAPEMNVI